MLEASMSLAPTHATLEVSLSAIAENYRRLSERLSSGACAGVIKANAYGLGAPEVAGALWKKGCRSFFVATMEEGIALREAGFLGGTIFIIHGVPKGAEKVFQEHTLSPVHNTLEQLKRWAKNGRTSILHIDTGMRRLGLEQKDVAWLSAHPELIKQAGVTHYMSHLACADDPKHTMNRQQLNDLKVMIKQLPKRKISFANSAGIYLGKNFHFDLARPGCALYGINPTPEKKNSMVGVARLTAPIFQIRTLEKRESVGYDATYFGKKGDRIATIGLGYADGYLRHLSNKGVAYLDGVQCSIVGRVSMDMVMLDVTHIPPAKLHPTTRAEFIGPNQRVDALADAAGTIGYEIFTRMGRRIERIYVNSPHF
jgi:alanine racemase